jgi:DNA mismatch repair protein MutS2
MARSRQIFYPQNFAEISDVAEVLHILASLCTNELSKQKALHPVFMTSADRICKEHEPVAQSIQLLEWGHAFPQLDFEDIREQLSNLKTPGWVVDISELHSLRVLLSCFHDAVTFLHKHSSAVALQEIIQEVVFHDHLLTSVMQVIDHEGNFREDASDELLRLSKEHARLNKDIEKRLHSIFKEMKLSGLAVEDTNLTIRNGRSVIPVPAGLKYKVKGIIHDESATGLTAYVEPLEIVEMGNRIRENFAARQREIRRILAEVSQNLHLYIHDILKYFDVLASLDFCFAKARFAVRHNAQLAYPEQKPIIQWKQARNIVLEQHLSRQMKKLIPLSLELSNENRMLVLSGANAGGKSVVIKTAALLQTMIQYALPVPFGEESKAGIFTSIFLDMGDGQSIEADLSTYSSHLETMKFFLNNTDKNTLYLIDEIGSGTDPILGGALAQSMLLELHSQGAFGIVSTHLDALKKMADETPEAGNSAMIFDTEKLQPSYVLRLGVPGNSFTFEIAARTGIPENIIEQAREFAGTERITFEQKISDVEIRAEQLRQSIEKQMMAEAFLDETIAKYTKLVEKVEQQQKEIIENTKLQAEEVISIANKTIENTIRKIKESGADREITKASRLDVDEALKQISNFTPEQTLPEKLKKHLPPLKKEKKTEPRALIINEGMRVKHKDNGMVGLVLEVQGHNKVKVAFNSVSMMLEKDSLIPLSNQTEEKGTQKIKLSGDLHKKAGNFSRQLDIRGNKAEDVLYALEKYIDDALLIGVYDFSVLHGKGHGVLRNVVRQLLSKHPNVEGFESEHVERGGDGITLVRLCK